MRTRPRSKGKVEIAAICASITCLSLGVALTALWAQVPQPDPPAPLESLKTVPVPEPANLGDFVADKATAIRLGKALFWDMQAGSDGVQACAACHFHAGADNRRKNQLSPGLLAGDTTFQIGGPNYTLEPKDFPFTKHQDENAAGSPIVSDAPAWRIRCSRSTASTSGGSSPATRRAW